jgi:hypothetical protein
MAPGTGYGAGYVPRPISAEGLDKDCIVVSCGGLNYEYTSYSTRSTNEWSTHLMFQHPGDKRAHYDLRNPMTLEIFQRTFEQCYPELCADRQIIVLDCTVFWDQDNGRSLRNHTGINPRIMEQVLNSKDQAFYNCMMPLQDIDPRQKQLIICMCRKGRHRAVAVKTLVGTAMDTYHYDGLAQQPSDKIFSIDLNRHDFWEGTCFGKCDDCKWLTRGSKDSIDLKLGLGLEAG